MGPAGDGIRDRIKGSGFVCPENGVAQSITIGCDSVDMIPHVVRVKCAIYRAEDNKFVGSTEEREFEVAIFGTWYTFNFLEPKPLLKAGVEYYLCAWTPAGHLIDLKFLTYPNAGVEQEIVYGAWPDPIGPLRVTNKKHSVYCTYTPKPPSPPPPPIDLPTIGGVALAVVDVALILYYIATRVWEK